MRTQSKTMQFIDYQCQSFPCTAGACLYRNTGHAKARFSRTLFQKETGNDTTGTVYPGKCP